jgi:hypothetical protein
MNNIIARKVELTTSWQALASENTVASVTITAPTYNAGHVILKGDTGDEVPLQAGEWHQLEHVNLAEIEVKGTLGDIVTIVGGTW